MRETRTREDGVCDLGSILKNIAKMSGTGKETMFFFNKITQPNRGIERR